MRRIGPPSRERAREERRFRRIHRDGVWMLAVGIVLLAIGAGLLWGLDGSDEPDGPAPSPTASVAPTPGT